MTALLRTLSILLFLLTISSALYLKGGETKYLVSLPSGWAGVGDPYVITDPVISTEPNFMWNIWIYIPINSTTVRAKICRGQTCIARRTFNGQLVLGQEPLWKAPDYLLIEDPVIPYHYKLVADHVLSYCDPIYTTACDYAPPADGSVLVQNIIVREVHINVPVLDIGVTNASSTWDSGSAITSWVGRPYAGASLYTRITCIDLPLNLTVSGAMWGVEIWYTFSQKNIAGLKQVEVRMVNNPAVLASVSGWGTKPADVALLNKNVPVDYSTKNAAYATVFKLYLNLADGFDWTPIPHNPPRACFRIDLNTDNSSGGFTFYNTNAASEFATKAIVY